MRTFDEYNKDYNAMKLRSGEKIFEKQLKGIEGVDVTIDNILERAIVHNKINPTSEKEYRSLHVPMQVEIKRGSYVEYKEEQYLVTTDIDDHYVYKSCKMQKCNQTLKWKQNGIIHEYPCIMANDSYGVKISSDNEYIRSQNIKAQITLQYNEITKNIIPDMRFIFNHSETDIYSVVDINKSLSTGIIVLTTEKVVYQREDNVDENLAFSAVLAENNLKDETANDTDIDDNVDNDDEIIEYAILGVDSMVQNTSSTFTLNPSTECEFYLNDFDSQNIATIISQTENECQLQAKKSLSNTWCTLYAKDKEDNILVEKIIKITKK